VLKTSLNYERYITISRPKKIILREILDRAFCKTTGGENNRR